MKIVLFSLNASRVHTNLAIRCLAESLKTHGFNEVTLIERTEKDNRNDTLSALVAVSAQADLLVILSDVDGLYSSDPRKDGQATLIERVDGVPESLLSLAGEVGSALGTGGMKTKIKAAKICMEQGVDTVIANGAKPELLYNIVEGKSGGYTRFFTRD